MKLDKLVKTLRRDLAANPLKAGVLGVLLLGGLYFWGPLVWKWVGKKGATASDVAVVSSPAQSPAGVSSGGMLPTSGAGENKETELAWREIHERRKTDPLARSADFRPQWSQTFQVVAPVAIVAKPEAEVEAKKQAEVDPRNLGLDLQGVVIGAQVKKAMISGKVYRELDSITVSQKSDPTSNSVDHQPEVVFKLARVYRKMVVLEREGKFWELKLTSAPAEKQQPTEVSPAEQAKEVMKVEKALRPEKAIAAPVKE